jgi:hypothetical protein
MVDYGGYTLLVFSTLSSIVSIYWKQTPIPSIDKTKKKLHAHFSGSRGIARERNTTYNPFLYRPGKSALLAPWVDFPFYVRGMAVITSAHSSLDKNICIYYIFLLASSFMPLL